MSDALFRARMRRADRRFQRALAATFAPTAEAPALPARPVVKTHGVAQPTVAQRLAMAKRDLKRGWDLDAAARHAGFNRAELDMRLWNSLGRAR